MEKKNVVFIGIGGIGGYFGGRVAQYLGKDSESYSTVFVARNEQLKRIKESGLVLNTPKEKGIICKPTVATDNINDIKKVDVCFICSKSYDLDQILHSIKPLVTKDTIIVGLLNGVNIYDRIKKIIPDSIVFPSCTYISSAITNPGEVTHLGGLGKMVLGPDYEKPEYIPSFLIDILSKCGIVFEWSNDVTKSIWEKFIFIAPMCLITANYNKTFGQVIESDDLTNKVIDIMKEINGIAKNKGVNLDENIIDKSIAGIKAFPYETKTSFQRDFEKRKPLNELDVFGETIIELGRFYGINTPLTEKMVNEIKSKLTQ